MAMKRYKSVDAYINDQDQWKDELIRLREIFHTTEFEETLKWSIPTYTINGKNVAGMAAFKNYFGIWFFQGVFLRDEKNVLINAQEEKTVAMRQWRFSSMDEIDEKLIKAYLAEAIQNQKDGKEVKPQKKPLVIPEQLQAALDKDASLSKAFEKFSLSHKREYADYINEAKREDTKQRRLEKIIPMILESVGLNDKYR